MARPTLPDTATVGDSGHTTDHNTIRGALAALYEEHTEGSGSPEGVVTATVGRTYADTTGGVLYVKATGSGNTGWEEVGTGTGGAVAPTNLLTANQAEPASATGWEAVTNCTVTWVGGTGLVVESLAAGAVVASTLEDTDGVVPTAGEQWVTGYVFADNESSVTGPVAVYVKGWIGVGSDTVKVAESPWWSVPIKLAGSTNFDRNDSDPDYDHLAVQVGWTAAAAGEQLVILKAGLWHGVGGFWVPPGDHTIPGQPAIEGSRSDGAVPSRVTSNGVVEWKELIQGLITAGDVDSETATAGHVLTADGDGLAAWEAPTGGAPSVQTYTPALTAATTNPTLGSASAVSGRYTQNGTHVTAWIQILFGTSGVNAGSGLYSVSLPVEARPGDAVANTIIGQAMLFDASPATYQAASVVMGAGGTVANIRGSSAWVAHNAPWAWAATDYLILILSYEADS